MNLYFRLLIMFIFVGFKKKMDIFDTLTTQHIVLPNDLDLLGHMNNGRYLTVADGARVELLIRAGLWKVMKKENIYPVLAAETIQFRKSLEPFERYQIKTSVVGWDEKYIYIEHQYIRKNKLHALAIVKARMIGKKQSRYSPQEFIQLIHPELKLEKTKNLKLVQKWNEQMHEHYDVVF